MTTEERLEHLERELSRARRCNRWVMIGGAACCLGMVLAWALLGHGGMQGAAYAEGLTTVPTTAPAQREVRASSFEVEDEHGNTKAILHEDDGGASLEFKDAKGKLRMKLHVDKNGPALGILDENEKLRLMLSDFILSMTDGDGTGRIMLVSGKTTGLFLHDDLGNKRLELKVTKSGSSIGLSDDKGNARCTIGSNATTQKDGRTTLYPESSIWLFGPDGKGLWSAPPQ